MAISNYERVGKAMDLLRLRFDEQVRSERRKVATGPLGSRALSGLTPWHKVMTPHPDVAVGRYQTSTATR